MDDPRPVGLGDAVSRLGQVTEEAPQILFVGVDQLRQRVPVDPLHRDVVDRVLCLPVALDRARPDLVDRDDARVVERRRGLGLDDEAPEPLLVADELRRQDLQRDAALEGEILGEIHLAHAAGSQRAHDPIVGNPVARRRECVPWGPNPSRVLGLEVDSSAEGLPPASVATHMLGADSVHTHPPRRPLDSSLRRRLRQSANPAWKGTSSREMTRSGYPHVFQESLKSRVGSNPAPGTARCNHLRDVPSPSSGTAYGRSERAAQLTTAPCCAPEMRPAFLASFISSLTLRTNSPWFAAFSAAVAMSSEKRAAVGAQQVRRRRVAAVDHHGRRQIGEDTGVRAVRNRRRRHRPRRRRRPVRPCRGRTGPGSGSTGSCRPGPARHHRRHPEARRS